MSQSCVLGAGGRSGRLRVAAAAVLTLHRRIPGIVCLGLRTNLPLLLHGRWLEWCSDGGEASAAGEQEGAAGEWGGWWLLRVLRAPAISPMERLRSLRARRERDEEEVDGTVWGQCR